jgi:hypothetical protein
MTAVEYSARNWTIKVRLVIEADDAEAASAINGEVIQRMGLMAKTAPQLTDFFVDGPRPCWYVITELDVTGLESITPDDAPTRFEFVVRELPDMPFMGHGTSHSGLWEWLSDSGGSASHSQSPHLAVRARESTSPTVQHLSRGRAGADHQC